jgi:hypothetical protein
VIVGKDAQEKDIEETHPEGSYYLYHDREWIGVGKDIWKHTVSATLGSITKSSGGYKESCRLP